MRRISLLLFAAAVSVAAFAQETPSSQEGSLGADFRKEWESFHTDCQKILGCLADIVHGSPLHVTGGSLAPGNGFAVGAAFSWEHNLSETWRSATNLEAMGGFNGSWMAGGNFRMIRVSSDASKLKPVYHRPVKGSVRKVELEHDPELNFYAEAVSLNKLSYYGLGQFTSRSSLAFYGMREAVVGGNGSYPLGNSGVSLFGQLNGRWVDLRSHFGETSPSIEQLYTEATAPGLLTPGSALGFAEHQFGVLQPGGGIRFDRDFAARFAMNYSATFDEFANITNSHYSFERLTLDFVHTIPWYGFQKKQSGPPKKEGSVELEARLVESYVPSGNVVPFYLQPTLGGADIMGEKMLASYPDYRFRAPNYMLFRATVEHSIYGPLGAMLMADTGRVGLTTGELGFNHLRHSYGAGLTIRAGGFPVVELLFAWGGHEGTHTIAQISPALLGGGSRPLLY